MRTFPLRQQLPPDDIQERIDAATQDLEDELLGGAPIPSDRDTIKELGELLTQLEDVQENTFKVTLLPNHIIQKYVTIPHVADKTKLVVMKVRGAPNLIYNEDFFLDISTKNKVYWVGTALETLLKAGDIVSLTYTYKNSDN